MTVLSSYQVLSRNSYPNLDPETTFHWTVEKIVFFRMTELGLMYFSSGDFTLIETIHLEWFSRKFGKILLIEWSARKNCFHRTTHVNIFQNNSGGRNSTKVVKKVEKNLPPHLLLSRLLVK